MNDFVNENVFFRWIGCHAVVFFVLDGLQGSWTQVLDAAAVLVCCYKRSIDAVIIFRYSQHFMLFEFR